MQIRSVGIDLGQGPPFTLVGLRAAGLGKCCCRKQNSSRRKKAAHYLHSQTITDLFDRGGLEDVAEGSLSLGARCKSKARFVKAGFPSSVR